MPSRLPGSSWGGTPPGLPQEDARAGKQGLEVTGGEVAHPDGAHFA
eukprot:CAMPEP_0180799932 /NCGR_PEP_ID=MMETSP1038_2-20121128/58823_1 /TAXON_ID=632150 /ORGANISM="Azadinium spinosum, Strain 3D9" /LENGTH=45 /DNA_ID= /DNA_START= /DNA_END= /DNA_ORIENTATION=